MNRESIENMLKDRCVLFRNDPGAFTRWMYDWRMGELTGWKGPDWWHDEVFLKIKTYLEGPETKPLKIAIASGHGAAKTAFIAWLVYWFMSCRANPQVTATANTETQLTTKTWRELAKWHKLAHNCDWFEWTATSFYRKGHQATWKANAIPWSENNSDAFAGTHEQSVLIVFDEASNIADIIWEVTENALTTKKNIWVVCGNGTRNVGRFYDCFHDNKGRWLTWNIDSRTSQAANRAYVDSLVEQYGGEDTDQTRTRIRGLFPRTSSHQLISTEAITKARDFEAQGYEYLPIVLGVDIARFGENSSVITKRQGRKVFAPLVLPKMDLMMTAHHVAEAIKAERPMQVFIDGCGIGAGVVDRLRQLNFSIVEVNAANESYNPRFLNKRAEMCWEMKEFIEGGCELPRDGLLERELRSLNYDLTKKTGRILIESKENIYMDHGFSPDRADSLALTFAYPISDDEEMSAELNPQTFED